MIESIFIKNYRNIEELELKNLKPINLITGKNNTGKTSLLEAFGILVSQDSYRFLSKIAMQRSGVKYAMMRPHQVENIEEINVRALSSLFRNRKIELNESILLKYTEFNSPISESVTLQLSKNEHKEDYNVYESFYTFNIEQIRDNTTTNTYNIPLHRRSLNNLIQRSDISNKGTILYFVESSTEGSVHNSLLFDKISLTEKETYVIEALHIIEPTLERIAFVDDGLNRRKAMVRLSDTKDVVPLESMGDGINRILTIILALLNAENGYLLIDEVENGLHYSVQENLWKIIFRLSKKLNIQVLATTHSNDCINSFEEVLNNVETDYEGKLIRLDHKKGKIVQVDFDKNELKIATDQNIEIR